MRTIITLWPVDKEFQKKIGIYTNSTVKNISVGRVMEQIAEAGYIDVSSYIEVNPESKSKKDSHTLHIHCRNLDVYK